MRRSSVAPFLLMLAVTAPVSAADRSPPAAAATGPWIVYNGSVGSGSGIRLVRTDGSDDRALFAELVPGEAWHPDWSPDGESIAFRVDDVDGTLDLWVGDVEGKGARRVYDCVAPCGWADDPAWSPDGRSLLFQRGTAVGDAGLGVGTVDLLDLASGAVTTLVTGAETEYFYVPRWAPDGQAFAVELDRFASGQLDESVVTSTTIAIVDLAADDQPKVRELLPTDRSATYPDWGATGSIVFMQPVPGAASDGPSDLYTVDPVGGDVQSLTTTGDDGRQALQPSWTPDGRRILFVEQDAPFTNVRMSMITPDGSGLTSATGAVDMFGTHPRLQPVP